MLTKSKNGKLKRLLQKKKKELQSIIAFLQKRKQKSVEIIFLVLCIGLTKSKNGKQKILLQKKEALQSII